MWLGLGFGQRQGAIGTLVSDDLLQAFYAVFGEGLDFAVADIEALEATILGIQFY